MLICRIYTVLIECVCRFRAMAGIADCHSRINMFPMVTHTQLHTFSHTYVPRTQYASTGRCPYQTRSAETYWLTSLQNATAAHQVLL